MDSQLVQRTRYQLQARVRRARGCPVPLFAMTCAQLLSWVESNPFLRALVSPLREASAAFRRRFHDEFAKVDRLEELAGPWPTETPLDAAALYLATLEEVSTKDFRSRQESFVADHLAAVVGGHLDQKHRLGEAVEVLRDVALQGFYEWLDEQVDSRNAVLGLLLKYKTRCEMYRRERLRRAAVEGIEGRTKERALAFDFYEYLHDQGVDFWIESVSASGEPDLVSRDAAGEPLVADAKYIDGGSDPRRTITAGFRQVLDYCRDHNSPVGYLVIFVDRDGVLDLQGDRDDGFPSFRTGGYCIYYVVVDIYEHATSASKRPKPRPLTITLADLIAPEATVPTTEDEAGPPRE